MANLLQDLLPDAPREAGILTAAAQKNVAGMLRAHIEQGMGAATAIRLASASFASSTAFAPQACEWVATELAVALGLLDAGEAAIRDPEIRNEITLPPLPVQDLPTIGSGRGRRDGPLGTVTAAARGAAAGSGAGRPGKRRRATLLMAGLVIAAIAAAAWYSYAGSPSHPGGASSPGRSPSSTPNPGPTTKVISTRKGRPPATSEPLLAPDDVWIAQLASVFLTAGTARLDAVLAKVQLQIPQAQVLDSSDYASLRPGFWVVYYQDSFTGGNQVLAYCSAHGRTTSSQCIGRYLSHDLADFRYQCYPPAASPSGSCYHGAVGSPQAGTPSQPGVPAVSIGAFSGIKPAAIDFSADGSSIVTAITWSAWNASGASGSGTWNHETCVPSCATGAVDKYTASLQLSEAENGLFTVLTTRWDGRTTTWYYPGAWPQGAGSG